MAFVGLVSHFIKRSCVFTTQRGMVSMTLYSTIEIIWKRSKLFSADYFNVVISMSNPFQNKPWFLRVCSTCLLKTMREKEKLLIMSNFSFSHIVFYPFRKMSAIFINFEIVVCKLFQFG